MDTGRGTSHTGTCWGVGDRGRITLGEIPNLDDGVIDAANHHGTCTPCNKLAHSEYVSQNFKYNNFKKVVMVQGKGQESSFDHIKFKMLA